MNDLLKTTYGMELNGPASGALEGAAAFAESIFETARESLLLLDGGLRIRAANRAFYASFQVAPADTIGKVLFELGNGQWDIPRLRELLEDILPRHGQLFDFEVAHAFETLGQRIMLINARQVFPMAGPVQGICLAIEDVTEKRQAKEIAQRLHDELEERVKQRTRELEVSNREMEAFSYSVSHDLRSPLRALEGYAKILLEDHAGELTGDALDYVHDIHRNALKMGQLISDLLTFSGLSRQAFEKRFVVPEMIVSQILREIQSGDPDRHVQVIVGDLPPCLASPALIKQVWENLLGNAFKYTLKQSRPRIEIGSREESGERIYFVKDNGAGFDMKYADKLFGVFQRLHKAADFEGTGVGLAIVKHIIERHGGRIWAEAAVNAGATFSFTLLPAEN